MAGSEWERERVRALRATGVPWSHVARQLGRNEQALRAIYEPVTAEPPARGAFEATPFKRAVQRPASTGPLTRPRKGDLGAAMLRILAERPLSSREVAQCCGAAVTTVSARLCHLRALGLVQSIAEPRRRNRFACWAISKRGVAILASDGVREVAA